MRVSKLSNAQKTKMLKESIAKKESQKVSNEMKMLKTLLSRKDILKLDNDKIDTLRLLMLHFEDKNELSPTQLVKFLKK